MFLASCIRVIFLTLFLLSQTTLFAYSGNYQSKSGHTKTYKIKSSKHIAVGSYKVGDTKYKVGQAYKTTGMPKVERSSSAKKRFLKNSGYSKVPNGYEVDHIVPLSKGGKDSPGNMQLLSRQQHKAKTASERKHK